MIRLSTLEPKPRSADPAELPYLLPGEEGTSELVEDAEHWIRVYTEFTRFKRGLFAEIEGASMVLTDELKTATATSDLMQLYTQYDRLLARLTFWENRLSELNATGT